jgi:hypothetical protein
LAARGQGPVPARSREAAPRKRHRRLTSLVTSRNAVQRVTKNV